MKTRFLFLFSLLFACATASAKEFSPVIAQFKVNAGAFERINTPVAVDVTAMQIEHPTRVALFESVDGQKQEIPCQMEMGLGRVALCFVLQGTTAPQTTRLFQLEYVRRKAVPAAVHMKDNTQKLTMDVGTKQALTYQYQPVDAPAGADKAFARGGFLHPATTPSGRVVTCMQPQDHLHHFGFFNPFTRVEYEGKEYDLWNIGDKKGTVRFDHFVSLAQGSVFARFDALHNNLIFAPEETNIMNDLWTVKLWNNALDSTVFVFDFVSLLTPSTPQAVIFPQYRYGGFCLRATEQWDGTNCEVLTSAGNSRDNTDSTRADWVFVKGPVDGAPASVLIMSNPHNINSPQPLRIWDSKQNKGKANVMINYCPSKTEAWKLEPGQSEEMGYRVVLMDGSITREQAQRYWQDYAHPPVVEAKQINKEFNFPKQYENKGSFLIIDYFHEHFDPNTKHESDKL